MAINAVFFRQNVKVPPREIRIGFRANMAVWKRYLSMSDVLPAAGDPVVAASAHIEAAGPFAQVVHIDADCGEEAPLFGYVEEIMGVAPDVHRTFRFAGNDDSRFQPQRIGQAVSEIAADAEDGAPAGMGVEIDLRTYAPGTSVLCRCVESAE